MNITILACTILMMITIFASSSIRTISAFVVRNEHRILSSSSSSSSRYYQTGSITRTKGLFSTTEEKKEISINTNDDTLKGINWLRECIKDTLNECYTVSDVAKGAAINNILKKQNKKKKKKKKKSSEDTNVETVSDETPKLTEEEIEKIGEEAYNNAIDKMFTLIDTQVTTATRDEFGDYQCNIALSLSKSLNISPRDCASTIINALEPKIKDICDCPPEIAGPGFINIKFTKEYLQQSIYNMALDADDTVISNVNTNGRLALPKTNEPQKIIVDYSSPNIAKEMHVGHLRSTIIGDTISNVLSFLGHDVVRLNHIGDWGTQFGMLVEHLRDEYPQALDMDNVNDIDLGDLVLLYKEAKKRFDVDEDFKVRSRDGVVKLQGGDRESLNAWEVLCAASRKEYQKIYGTLGINKGLIERGESFYNPYLSTVIEDLCEQKLAVDTEGAKAIFLPGYTNRDGTPLPLLVQKSDGGYMYATTDLAAIKQRVQMSKEENGEEADRVLYVTDSGQSQHFDMVFQAAKMANFIPPSCSLEHVPFGLVQGEDGKKFATRSGDTVKLKDLLDKAIEIAGDDIKSRMKENSDDENENASLEITGEIQNVINTVGIGAVKYADLSMNRESNYKFSYERMLSLNGNTAPYMLYAYARICSIVRKASSSTSTTNNDNNTTSMSWPEPSPIIISHESELSLIRNLVRLPDILADVEKDLYPNKICDYLFETSQKFNQFYENCAVNKAETEELKNSRLTICTVTAATIRLLLNILGIDVVDKM